MSSPPCPTQSATSPASIHSTALPPNTAPSGSISAPASALEASVPFAPVAGLLPPGPSEQISRPSAVNIPTLSTAATIKSPTLTTLHRDVLSSADISGCSILAPDQSAASFLSHAPPPLSAAATITSAVSHLGAEQQLTLNQVAKQTQAQPQSVSQQQTPVVQQQLYTMVTEPQTQQIQQPVPLRQLQSQHQALQEQAQVQQDSKLQQSLKLQQQQSMQKQIPQSNMTEVPVLPQLDHTELSVSLQDPQQALLQQQPQQYTQHLLQQQLQMPQQVMAPQAAVQQQGQIDHQQQLHLQQTMQFQQQQMSQQQQKMFMSTVILKPDQTQLVPFPGSQQLFQQQQMLNVGPVQSQQMLVQQTQVPAELAQQNVQTHLKLPHFDQQQQEMVKAAEAPPIQQQLALQKQSSLQMSESEASAGDTSVTEDMCSHSASFYPTSDSSLPPLHQSTAEAPTPALSHTLTPSPAQPSSVAESDSEGPPKIEYVDNRIKTLDEKLRNLLYQEYSSGAPVAGGATSCPSTASSLVGGDRLCEPQSFPPPASSSDTSPHSSSSSTSSSTSRSSSTSPGTPERVGAGKEGPRVSELLTMEEQPSTSIPSTSTSSTPPTSLMLPKQEDCAGPQRLPVPGEPTILVSDDYHVVS